MHTLLHDLVFSGTDDDAIFFPSYKNDEKIMNYLKKLGLKVFYWNIDFSIAYRIYIKMSNSTFGGNVPNEI